MSLQKIPDVPSVAFWVGSSAASAIVLFGTQSINMGHRKIDWKEFAVYGAIGAIIGARYGVSNPWWNLRW